MSEGTNRRSFLKTAVAAPLAVALPFPAPSVATLAAAAPPAPAAYPWSWWYCYGGSYDEHFTEEFHTKEAALKYLSGMGEGYIAECQRQDFDLRLDGDSVFEMLMGQNEDIIGEGEFLDNSTGEQVKDLGVMVSAAIEAWVQKHKIDTAAWTFGGVRNEIRAETDTKKVFSDAGKAPA